MSVIHIKKIQKASAEHGVQEFFAVTSVGIATPQGKKLIPNPAGKEALLFETLEEAESAIRRAGFDYEFQGKTTYLFEQAKKQKTVGATASLDSAVPILIQRLHDREPTVVANSVFALGMLRATEALESIVGILGHDDAGVRKSVSELRRKVIMPTRHTFA
jgi:hypothetical protein